MNQNDYDIDAGLGALHFGEVSNKKMPWQKDTYRIKKSGEDVHIVSLQNDAERVAFLLKKYGIKTDKILQFIIDEIK